MRFADWDTLLYGIERGQCILFLGPEVAVETPDGPPQAPTLSLAYRLIQALGEESVARLDPRPNELARVAQRFLTEKDDVALERQLVHWHREWLARSSPLHQQLAALPFRLIVTSSVDPLMETALRAVGKLPVIERYHYRGRNKELIAEPTIAAPVLFYLFGYVNEPESAVLTEMQLLDFLARLIGANPPLPNDLNATLTHGKQFLFLGFGLKEWYLRILFHVLKVLRTDSRGFAIEALESSSDGAEAKTDSAILFYRDNFKMDLVQMDTSAFARELYDRFVASGGLERVVTTTAAPDDRSSPVGVSNVGPSVFICHASEDEHKAREVHDALKRAGLQPWLDKDVLRGGDRWDDLIESTIKKIDYFVILNSRALAAKARGASYVNKEINVALKAEEWRLVGLGRFIVPASIDDTPLLEPLSGYHAVDLRSQDGLRDLVRAIKRQVGAA